MPQEQDYNRLDDAIQAFREKLKQGGISAKHDGKEKQNQDKWAKAIRDLQRKR